MNNSTLWFYLFFILLFGFFFTSVFVIYVFLKKIKEKDEHNFKMNKDLENKLNIETEEKSRLNTELAVVRQQLEHEKGLVSTKINDLKLIMGKLEFIEKEKNDLEKEIIKLSSSVELDEKKQDFIKKSNEQLETQFKVIANRIFDEKGKDFSDKNSQQVSDILKPLKNTMVESFMQFKEKVEKLHVKDSEDRAVLNQQVKELKESNLKMNDEAKKLSTALKHESKTQGNWGELILENLLERSGLQKDKDYSLQVNFKTEDGRRQPDVIVNLPQNRHIVIDSKVSLNSYLRLVDSKNEEEKKLALNDLSIAIKARIKELADRSYFQLPGLKTPDVVLMFIPNESAFIEVHRRDEFLAQTALDKNVLVTCPTTLLTSLKIVSQIWRFEEQNANTKKLVERARLMFEKFSGFIDNMQKLGDQIENTRSTYHSAFSQLHSGKGNLINQAQQLVKLGVSTRSKLPQHLINDEELEIIHQSKLVSRSKNK